MNQTYSFKISPNPSSAKMENPSFCKEREEGIWVMIFGAVREKP